MIAVVSELWPFPNRKAEYVALALELRPHLEAIDGFISSERFESCGEPGKYLSFSLWRDEEALSLWRNLEEHRLIMEKGRGGILRDYHIRVTRVLWTMGSPTAHKLLKTHVNDMDDVKRRGMLG